MSFEVDTVELRKAMIERNITTIGELAELSGVDRNTLGRVVNGKCRPSTLVMEKLVVALDMQPCKAGAIFFKPNLRNA